MIEQQNALSSSGPESIALYQKLLESIRLIGPFQEEMKKTSIHLVRRSAFAGVQFRKVHLLLTLKASRSMESSRMTKVEQLSKNRWYMVMKLTNAGEIDAELMGWIRESYDLCASQVVDLR